MELAALAQARLGISAEDFGRMGPGYITLLCRELEDLDFRHHYPAAAIQALLANIYKDPESARVFEPLDFMPGWETNEAAHRIASVGELITLLGAKRADAK